MTARGTGPPGNGAGAPAQDPGNDADADGGSSLRTLPDPLDIPRCEAAGILCQVLGWFEREAAGRARLYCRSYLYGYGDDGEVSP